MGETQMMDFISFARAHGVLIDRIQDDSKWHRVPTETHPRKKNGAYRHCGTHGHIQDHATMLEPVMWSPDANAQAPDLEGIARRAKDAAEQIRQGQEYAAKRAAWIFHQCKVETHPYLESKGFAEELGRVWADEKGGDKKLVVPMFSNGHVVGAQTISDKPGFEKRFLFGQKTSEAVYVIDNKGPNWFCEGYATGLSVRAALQALKVRYTIIICFSASNLCKVAKNHGEGTIVADYDKPTLLAPNDGGMGIKVAMDAGLRYWSSGKEGVDFNDFHRAAGLFQASQALKLTIVKSYQK